MGSWGLWGEQLRRPSLVAPQLPQKLPEAESCSGLSNFRQRAATESDFAVACGPSAAAELLPGAETCSSSPEFPG